MSIPRFLDVHVLQTVPPSNINRDDAGSPKQALYGGVRRARVSSQAWKRAAREYLAERQPAEQQSTRTKRLVGLVAPLVADRAGIGLDDATRICVAVVQGTVPKMGKKPEETSYLLFFGRAQVSAVADLIAERAEALLPLDGAALASAGKEITLLDVLGTGHPTDVALYGRMVADLASLNVDAATQVAHAISTHPVEVEFDYFTAVDDENREEETGAGMIGTVEFNSATLYRYATVGISQLAENLGSAGAVAPAATQFVESFVKSMPSGHQNSFGNRTRPALVVVIGRDDQPVSLVNAFEDPVHTADGGYERASALRLAQHYHRELVQWGDAPTLICANYVFDGDVATELASAFGRSVAFGELVATVGGVLEGSDPS